MLFDCAKCEVIEKGELSQRDGLIHRLRPVFDPKLTGYPVIVFFKGIQVLFKPFDQT